MTLPSPSDWLVPDWQPHASVTACVSTRLGEFSPPPWQGFNLGLNCKDDVERVTRAREHLQQQLSLKHILWLKQVHGCRLIDAATQPAAESEADASLSHKPGVACAILTADCLPVLFARKDGSAVAAAHAGWRGLAAGILSATARSLAPEGAAVSAWLGPAICQLCYQVDDAVRDTFLAHQPSLAAAFRPDGNHHYRLSLTEAATLELTALGVEVTASGLCTSCHNDRFYSYRKENGQTGRFASLVWLA